MLELATTLALGAIAIAIVLCLARLVAGPHAADRILALDKLYITTIALVIVRGIRLESAIYFEAALLIALLGFVGTVALARYLVRGSVIDE